MLTDLDQLPEGIDPQAFEAVLPPDAPEDHEIWKKVNKLSNEKWPLAYFYFGPQKWRFQTTLSNCLTAQATLRITRACYMRFEEGDTPEQVKDFRDGIYKRIKALREGNAAPKAAAPRPRKAEVKASSERARAPSGASPQASAVASSDRSGQEAGTSPAEQSPLWAEMPASARRSLPESSKQTAPKLTTLELPADSPALQQLRLISYDKTNLVFICRAPRPDGKSQKFTVSLRSTNNNAVDAFAIARLALHMFLTGSTEEQCQQKRAELTAQCGFGAESLQLGEGAAPRKRRLRRDPEAQVESEDARKKKRQKHGESDEVVLQRLAEQGRLEGALRLQGRGTSKKNHTINGIYSLTPGGHGGALAYEKECATERRVIVFHKRKSRWKVCEEPESKNAFAFLIVPEAEGAGQIPPSDVPSGRWSVYEGKDQGYLEDLDVRCVRIESSRLPQGAKKEQEVKSEVKVKEEKVKKEEDEQALKDMKEKTAEVSQQGKKVKVERADTEADGSVSGADNDSDEDTESGDSSGESDSSSSGSSQPASGPTSNGAPAVPSLRRACAKMLVRAGLRCACHYVYRKDCPTLRPPGPGK